MSLLSEKKCVIAVLGSSNKGDAVVYPSQEFLSIPKGRW